MRSKATKIFLIGFLLNLAWEFSHTSLFTVGKVSMFGPHWLLAIYATLADAVFVLIALSVFPRNKLGIIISGIIVATVAESIALHFGMWQYKNNMPLVPLLGIGLSPFVQLAITAFLTSLIVNKSAKLSCTFM
jgi:hypothetical protein